MKYNLRLISLRHDLDMILYGISDCITEHYLLQGGNFVVKMFTMFESETVCMLYLLSICFHQIEVFKPATSKEGNSEVYVVCCNFEKTSWLEKFLAEQQVCIIAKYFRYSAG